MDSLIFALNATLPIVLVIFLGYALKRYGLITESFAKQANKLVFRVFLPVMLFLNVYKIGSIDEIDLGFAVYAVCAVFIIFLIALPSVMLFVKDGAKRGALLQAIFRSNFAIIGIPVAELIAGEEGVAIASVLSVILIPVFNILAVISLSVFSVGEKKVSPRSILVGIVRNPLIVAVTLGLVTLAVRALFIKYSVEFRLSNIEFIYKGASYVSSLATPLALVALGAQFEFSALMGAKRELIYGAIARCIVVPAAAIGVAFALFRNTFGGAEFATFIAAFATPVAVSSVPMAQEMGADARLAGQLVVATTLGSCLSVFASLILLGVGGIF